MTSDTPLSRPTPIRIILIEDNHEYRRAISIALSRTDNYQLIAKYGTAEQALRELQNNHQLNNIDIILLDLNLPNLSGIDSIEWIRQYAPNTRIIILTQSDRKEDVIAAIKKGATGYLLKSSNIRQIKDAINTALEGGASLDGKITHHLMDQILEFSPSLVVHEDLSERELQVLQLLSQGDTKKEIGDSLNISPHTVATHVKNIYIKLGVLNGPAAISKAYEAGILPLKK